MKKYIVFILSFYLIATGYCQKIIINGVEGNRPLQWKDFTGSPDHSAPFFANTHWNLAFKNHGVSFKSDTAVLKGFEVVLNLDPDKSWVIEDKETNELLKHEQGHFDIAIICQREIIRMVDTTVFMKADMQSKLNGLFTSILEKYKLMEKKYDRETNHSADKEQQEKWNSFIKDELSR